MARQRPRGFQNLNQAPRDCTLYFDHTFLCRWSGRNYGFYVGRVYGSTVFHATRRIQWSCRISTINLCKPCASLWANIYKGADFFEWSRTYPSLSVLTVRTDQHCRSPCSLERGYDCHLGRCWHGGKVLCIRGRPIKNVTLLLRVQN